MRGAEDIFLCSLLLAGAVCEAVTVKPALKSAVSLSGKQHAGHPSRTGHLAKPSPSSAAALMYHLQRNHDSNKAHYEHSRSKARHEHKAAASAQASEPQPARDVAKDPEPQLTPGAANVSALQRYGAHRGRPTHPGCWMKMPSGCPKLPVRTQTWRHDAWAEQRGLDERGCLRRKRTWDKYCERDDADMLYISSATTREGISALQIGLSDDWPKWPWSQGSKGGGGAEAAQPAGAGADSAVAEPTRPGCYMRMPSGCPKQPMKTIVWRSDQWADQNKLNEAGCVERKATWDAWCGAEDAQMLYVPSNMSNGAELQSAHPNKAAVAAMPAGREAHFDELIANPSEPGCYMRMPSGCPKQPMSTQAWRHDTWAEQQDLDEESCKGRKLTWDAYCESDDAKVLFVPKQ